MSLFSTPIVRNYGILIADIVLLFLLLNYLPFEDAKVTSGLSILIFIAVLWLTEAIHVSVTALLVPILATLLGVFSTKAAFSHFGDPIIFLFLGGFALATALHKQELDKAIANKMLMLAKGNLGIALILLFAITAFLSMWISNTATAAMMLPLVIGMLSQLDEKEYSKTWTFALLGIAYCASIGGMGTLVGSPPNAIAAAATGMTFMDWMEKALPLMLLLLPTSIIVLFFVLRPNLKATIKIQEQTFEWNKEKVYTLAIFLMAVVCWIFSAKISDFFGGVSGLDSIIAMSALILLCIFRTTEWKDIEKGTDWGVLMLFGGGLCLSAMMGATGTSKFLAHELSALIQGIPPLLVILSLVLFVNVLTEFTSNTATAALFVPVFVAIAPTLGIDPVALATMIALSASCAFMLPVATPPNAIVFGTGRVPQRTMMKSGLWLNVFCVLFISFYAWLFW